MTCASAAEICLHMETKLENMLGMTSLNSLVPLWIKLCIYYFSSHSPASCPDFQSGLDAGFLSGLETLMTVNLEGLPGFRALGKLTILLICLIKNHIKKKHWGITLTNRLDRKQANHSKLLALF